MNCKKCRMSVNVLDLSCPGCGASLSLLEDDSYTAVQEDNLFTQTNLLIDKELADMQREMFGEPAGSVSAGSFPVRRLADLNTPVENMFLQSGFETLTTSQEEMFQIAAFVISSPHVQANLLYRQRAGETSLVYLAEETTVNAFATDSPHPDIEATPPLIVIFGGMANATRLTSLAMAYHQAVGSNESRHLFAEIIRTVGKTIVAGGACLDIDQITKIFVESGLAELCKDDEIRRKARSYGAAMNMTVIAHELGHISLGHTLKTAPVPEEISRNQEREADSFSASIAGASPFSDYTVAGGIFWWVILTWVAVVTGETRVTTHPHSRERLMDYIRANLSQAESLGIDAENIQQFLP